MYLGGDIVKNGVRIISQIIYSQQSMARDNWSDVNDEPAYNDQNGWTDENGAYHDEGWNQSWHDGGWTDSHGK
jgi:hypothetical protein